MERPLALKLTSANPAAVHRVSLDSKLMGQLSVSLTAPRPAIVVTREAVILPEMSAGVFDSADVVALSEGDWADTILVVLPKRNPSENEEQRTAVRGDAKFLAHVNRVAPALADLAAQTIAVVRAAGVDGDLVEGSGGRWVNRPLNTFTLKVQPRAGNLQFTLYGNPGSYRADGFLLQDQNSYSRGWLCGLDDVGRFADLAKQSHGRRRR